MSKKLIIFLLIILALVAWSAYSYLSSQGGFFVRDVVLELEVPEEVVSGEEAIFTLIYKNKTKADLKEVELVTIVSGVREVKVLSDILAGEEGSLELPITLVGQPEEEREVKVYLRYIPDNFSSVFEARVEESIVLTNSSILLKFENPETVSAGEKFKIILTVVSKSEEVIKDPRVVFDFPVEYELQSSNPSLGEGDVWSLEDLKLDDVKTITLEGILSGGAEQPEFVARLNNLAETESSVLVVGVPLVIFPFVEGRFTPGEKLEFSLVFENKSELEFKDVSIEATLSGRGFDASSVFATSGSFDKFQDKITWTSSGEELLSLIKPGDRGEVTFEVDLLDNIPVIGFSDKNIVMGLTGKITTQGNLSASFEEEYKLNSEIGFKVRGFYNDTSSTIVNSGPLPPVVGEETTYTVHWQLSNGLNDLENVIVSGSLPVGITWASNSTSNQGNLYYDSNENEVVWEIPRVPAHAGSLLPTYEAVFQLRLSPVLSQVGRVVPILSESIFSAKDEFTEKTLTARGGSVRTNLEDDPTVSKNQGIVKQ